jgi:hypothetical protein
MSVPKVGHSREDIKGGFRDGDTRRRSTEGIRYRDVPPRGLPKGSQTTEVPNAFPQMWYTKGGSPRWVPLCGSPGMSPKWGPRRGVSKGMTQLGITKRGHPRCPQRETPKGVSQGGVPGVH